MFSKKAIKIFNQATKDFKQKDSVDQKITNKYNQTEEYIQHILYKKSWIDTIQWAYEDIIRDPKINPVEALSLKRKIDASNQDRTDTVELIDDYFLEKYGNIPVLDNASINTESPAWALDRLSILELKIYHMRIEANRADASETHRATCKLKLSVLIQQRDDLLSLIHI